MGTSVNREIFRKSPLLLGRKVEHVSQQLERVGKSPIVVVFQHSATHRDLGSIQGSNDTGSNGTAKEPNTPEKGDPPFRSQALWSGKGGETLIAFILSLSFHYLAQKEAQMQEACNRVG